MKFAAGMCITLGILRTIGLFLATHVADNNFSSGFIMLAPTSPHPCGIVFIVLVSELIIRWKKYKSSYNENKMKWNLYELQIPSSLVNYRSRRRKRMNSWS